MKITGIVENGTIKLPEGVHLREGMEVTITLPAGAAKAGAKTGDAEKKAPGEGEDLVPGLPAGLC